MAIDYGVTLDCQPRQHFGDGNPQQGTIEILEKLKSRDRAKAIRDIARSKGIDLSNQKITLNVHDRDGNPIQKQVTVAELESEAQVLDQLSAACVGCPANFLGQPYGCYGAIHYPISAAGESWLLSRVQPPGSLGALLCADFLSEFSVTGQRTAQLRQEGLFESKHASKAPIKKAFLKSVSITADQLCDILFQSGNTFSPSHCLLILLWLGAIRFGDVVPASDQDRAAYEPFTTEDAIQNRATGTQLDLGPAPTSDGELAFQTFIHAMYLAWVHDVPLYISA
jgi:hypothetical protein